MKAKLISQRVSDSSIDETHGGSLIRRLIIEELDGLCFNIVGKQVYAFKGFNLDHEDYALLGEVEVSQEIVNMAVAIAQQDFELKLARAKLFIEVSMDKELKKKMIAE